MRKIFIAALALTGIVACQQDNIAFIDNSEIIGSYQEKKDLDARIKTKVDKFNKKRDSISQSFQLEYNEAATKSKGMSQKAEQELLQLLNEKRQFLVQQLQLEEQQLQQESQSEIDTLVKRMKAFIQDYGKQKNYTYILGANDGGSVLYGTEAKDITEAVLKALNDNYKNKGSE